MNRRACGVVACVGLALACGAAWGSSDGAWWRVANDGVAEQPSGARIERGTLRRGDTTLTTGEFYDEYEFSARQGQRIVVTLESDEFDAYLIVIDPDEKQTEHDDNSRSNRNARVEMTAPRTGRYQAVATSASPRERGAYVLSIEVLDAPATVPDVAPTPRREGVGRPGRNERPGGSPDRRPERAEAEPVAEPAVAATRPERPAPRPPRVVNGPESRVVERGRLEEGDEQLDSGEWVDEYRFTALAGQHVVVRMNARDFDTYLIVQPPEGEQIDNDDHGGSTQVSFIETTATTDGEWVVQATSFEAGEEGDYTLTMSVSNSDRFYSRERAVPIEAGREARGRLDRNDLQRFTGEYADVYTFAGEPGRFYTVEVNGRRNLDTYLLLEREGGANLSNDDFEGQLSRSRLGFLVTQPGPVDLIVSTFEAGSTGEYTVRMEVGDEVPEWHHEPSVTAGRVFGVFAGITDYSSRDQTNLEFCALDAERAHAAAIESLGMSQGDGVLLMDDHATAEAIEEAVRRFGAQMDHDDVLIVFYSGHGGQVDRTTFQPLDPDMRDETLVLADRDMTDDELDELLTSVRRGTVVVVLDSCHSGGFAKDVISRPGRIGLFASAEDCLSVVAREREAGGYLSDFFVEAIGRGREEADSNGDGKMTVIELCQFIAERYRTEVVSDSKPPAAPREWTSTISPSEYRGYQQLLIDRGGIGPHEVLFGW